MKVSVRSRNGGRDRLSKRQVTLLRDFVKWACQRMMPRIDDLQVDLYLDGNLFKSTNTYGLSIWEDTHVRGRHFSVEVDTTFSFITVLHTLSHEMVHVKQWATGEYYPLLKGDEKYVFMKKKYDATRIDYWELPWEVEAHGRSIGLLVLWMRERELQGESWANEKIPLH